MSNLMILPPSLLWNVLCYEFLGLNDIAVLEYAMTNKELSLYFQLFQNRMPVWRSDAQNFPYWKNIKQPVILVDNILYSPGMVAWLVKRSIIIDVLKWSMFSQHVSLIKFLTYRGDTLQSLKFYPQSMECVLEACSYCPCLKKLNLVVNTSSIDITAYAFTLDFLRELKALCPNLLKLEVTILDDFPADDDIIQPTVNMSDIITLWPNIETIKLPCINLRTDYNCTAYHLSEITIDNGSERGLVLDDWPSGEDVHPITLLQAPLRRVNLMNWLSYSMLTNIVRKSIFNDIEEITLSYEGCTYSAMMILSSYCKKLRCLSYVTTQVQQPEASQEIKIQDNRNNINFPFITELYLDGLKDVDMGWITSACPQLSTFYLNASRPSPYMDVNKILSGCSHLKDLNITTCSPESFNRTVLHATGRYCQDIRGLHLTGDICMSIVDLTYMLKQCCKLESCLIFLKQMLISYLATLMCSGHSLQYLLGNFRFHGNFGNNFITDVNDDMILVRGLLEDAKPCKKLSFVSLTNFQAPIEFWELMVPFIPNVREFNLCQDIIFGFNLMPMLQLSQLRELSLKNCTLNHSLNQFFAGDHHNLRTLYITMPADDILDQAAYLIAGKGKKKKQAATPLSKTELSLRPGHFPKLRNVTLVRCGVSDKTVDLLSQACPNIYSLTITSDILTSNGLNSIASHCKHLDRIKLGSCSKICMEGVSALRESLPELRFEDLTNCTKLKKEVKKVNVTGS